jgi:hypothetical protein
MSDDPGLFTNWRQKVFSALVLLLLVALGARIAADLLEPLVPVLVAVVVLGVVGWVVLGRRR